MTNTLESVLTEAIVDGKKAVGGAVNWALEQAPDLCEQYLSYQFLEAVTWATVSGLASIAIITVAALIIRLLFKCEARHWDDNDKICSSCCVIVISLVFLLFTVGSTLKHTLTAVKVKISPKVYLVEFASKLVK